MEKTEIAGGVVHPLPADLRAALQSRPQALAAWENITPLARNEWICWIESAKKVETREKADRLGMFQFGRGKAPTLLLARL